MDPGRSLSAAVTDLLRQAQKRQSDAPGATFVGTVLQHLVGAKLALVCGDMVQHHGASVADGPSGRKGDFCLDDVAIHVTVSPSETLIRKCAANLGHGLRPLIVTLRENQAFAASLARQQELDDRIDVFSIEQFIAGNIYELGKFASSRLAHTAEQVIAKYNEIVDSCETDPSLRIEGP